MTHRLTVPQSRVIVPPSQFANWAGRRNPVFQKAHQKRLPWAFFVACRLASPMAAGSGTPSGVPVPFGRFPTPLSVRHPIAVGSDQADSAYQKESKMTDTFKGAISPTITLSQKAVEKRLRRKLAHVGFILRSNRQGTAPFDAYGPCHVEEPKGRAIIKYGCTLEELARHYGAIQDHEMIGGAA